MYTSCISHVYIEFAFKDARERRFLCDIFMCDISCVSIHKYTYVYRKIFIGIGTNLQKMIFKSRFENDDRNMS